MLTTPLEKFSFDASLSLSISLLQICKYAMHGRNGIGSWSGEAAFIVTGAWFDDSATRMSGKKTNEMGAREDVGGKGSPPFLPLNSKVSTFQLGHVHCTRWARTCAQMPAGALGIQPFSPLPPDGNWKIRSENHGSQKFYENEFLENHPRRAMDRNKVSVGDDRLLGNSCSRSIEKFRVSKVKLTIFSSISKEMDGFQIGQ